MRHLPFAAVSLAAMLLAGSADAAEPPENCRAAKNQNAGKYAACRMKAEAANIRSADPARYAAAIAACETKFAESWTKAEEKAAAAGSSCPDDQTGSEELSEFLADCMDCVASSLTGGGASCGCSLCPGAGVFVGDSCWYLGALGASCDATCAAAGLAYDELTKTYAGSDAATFVGCNNVLEALGTAGTTHGDENCGVGFGLGCSMHLSVGRTRCVTPATEPAATEVNSQRACACQ